jgi:hypothetical protein
LESIDNLDHPNKGSPMKIANRSKGSVVSPDGPDFLFMADFYKYAEPDGPLAR